MCADGEGDGEAPRGDAAAARLLTHGGGGGYGEWRGEEIVYELIKALMVPCPMGNHGPQFL